MRENIRLIQQLEKDKERRKERNYEFKFLIKLIFRDKKKKKWSAWLEVGTLLEVAETLSPS